jgi:hypothetical protein
MLPEVALHAIALESWWMLQILISLAISGMLMLIIRSL